MIKLDRKAQSLQLKVQIGCKGSKEGGAVKDLKQASLQLLVVLPPLPRGCPQLCPLALPPACRFPPAAAACPASPAASRIPAWMPIATTANLLCRHPRVQLSGGERSYTTVAFTLALGGHTEMPFRAMDEFDVVGGPWAGRWGR